MRPALFALAVRLWFTPPSPAIHHRVAVDAKIDAVAAANVDEMPGFAVLPVPHGESRMAPCPQRSHSTPTGS